MNKACSRFRDLLVSGDTPATDHSSSCPECRRFIARLEGYRRGMAARHAGVTASGDFSTRMRSRLVRDQADGFTWALGRLLPATAMLVLLLAIWAARTPSPLDLAPATTDDDLLAWTISDLAETP